MKTFETFQKDNGKYSWRIQSDEGTQESPKEFPTEHAAQRNMQRNLKRPKHPIPPAKTQSQPTE